MRRRWLEAPEAGATKESSRLSRKFKSSAAGKVSKMAVESGHESRKCEERQDR